MLEHKLCDVPYIAICIHPYEILYLLLCISSLLIGSLSHVFVKLLDMR